MKALEGRTRIQDLHTWKEICASDCRHNENGRAEADSSGGRSLRTEVRSHGLQCTAVDLSTGSRWGCGGVPWGGARKRKSISACGRSEKDGADRRGWVKGTDWWAGILRGGRGAICRMCGPLFPFQAAHPSQPCPPSPAPPSPACPSDPCSSYPAALPNPAAGPRSLMLGRPKVREQEVRNSPSSGGQPRQAEGGNPAGRKGESRTAGLAACRVWGEERS